MSEKGDSKQRRREGHRTDTQQYREDMINAPHDVFHYCFISFTTHFPSGLAQVGVFAPDSWKTVSQDSSE